jgi:hypothetical protein
MLSESTVTTTFRVLGLRVKETASRYKGWLQIYRISSCGQPTAGGPPVWGLGGELTTLHHKTQYLLRNTTHSLGPGRIVCHNLSTRNFIWDLVHNLYSCPDIITQIKSRRRRWAGNVVRMGEECKAYKFMVWNPDRRRPLGRPKRRSEDGIRMDVGLIFWRIGFDCLRTRTGVKLLWMRWWTDETDATDIVSR